jgi:hypothetical protein
VPLVAEGRVMAAAKPKGKLMDAALIVAELGVTRAQADRIIRWCHERSGAIRPVDGARKLYVERADVDAWLAESRTRSAVSAIRRKTALREVRVGGEA